MIAEACRRGNREPENPCDQSVPLPSFPIFSSRQRPRPVLQLPGLYYRTAGPCHEIRSPPRRPARLPAGLDRSGRRALPGAAAGGGPGRPRGDPTIGLDLLFTHPMEQGPVMEMGPPRQFGVLVGGKRHDLLGGPSAAQPSTARRPTPAPCRPRGRAIMSSFSNRPPTGNRPSRR